MRNIGTYVIIGGIILGVIQVISKISEAVKTHRNSPQ